MWDTSGSSPVQIPNPSVFSGDLRSGFAPTCTDYEAADYLKTLRFDVPFLVMLIGFIIIKTRSIAHLVYRFCGHGSFPYVREKLSYQLSTFRSDLRAPKVSLRVSSMHGGIYEDSGLRRAARTPNR